MTGSSGVPRAATGESAREAVQPDVPSIRQLLLRAAEEKADQRGGPHFLAGEAHDLAGRLDELLGFGRLFVGTFDGVVLGAAAYTPASLADDTRVARIELLVVDPEARSVGIGEAMMDLIVASARGEGCVALDAWALPGDRSTKNFFESFGLKARLLTLSRSLED